VPSSPNQYAGDVTSEDSWVVRAATTADIRPIAALIQPLVDSRILLGKDLVVLFEAVQEFTVAVDFQAQVVGCGALHAFWEDLGEIRTLSVDPRVQGQGVGHQLLQELENQARQLGLTRLFCLTFEVEFFTSHGFVSHDNLLVDPEVYAEMVRSPDEGLAEFLNLARVKPNTLGNSRMVKNL
jgi:amino-acid N-acetyltransferase